ncbi:MAG: SUF system Fe-S cluster assembly protein [Acidobacteriia bacterium]|nr:SUF system Fe-S cluster assembly protein [Terriglobia bacterium]
MKELEGAIVYALKTVFDPEIPVNIYDLGLIYGIDVDDAGAAHIKMTLTAPSCPVAGILPGQVEAKVREVPGVTDVKLELVWDPPWDRSMMSDVAKLELGFDLGFDVINVTNFK